MVAVSTVEKLKERKGNEGFVGLVVGLKWLDSVFTMVFANYLVLICVVLTHGCTQERCTWLVQPFLPCLNNPYRSSDHTFVLAMCSHLGTRSRAMLRVKLVWLALVMEELCCSQGRDKYVKEVYRSYSDSQCSKRVHMGRHPVQANLG